jgi:hypothetical protein
MQSSEADRSEDPATILHVVPASPQAPLEDADASQADAPSADAPRADARPPRPRFDRKEIGIVAAFAIGTMGGMALLLRFAFGAADARGRTEEALAPIGTPPHDQCAIRRDDGRIVGKVVALMARGGRLVAYRVEEWPGQGGVAPAASTLDVRIEGVKMVPCASLQPPRPVR